MSSIFYININTHENPSNNLNSIQKVHDKNGLKPNRLLIEPQKIVIIYQQQKTYVEKILVQSTFGQCVNFRIIQPKKNHLNVKYKKSQLNPKQTNQIFLFFNCQNQKSLIEDQFIIILDKERFQLHIPITCRPKFRTSHRKLSLTKSLKTLQLSDMKNKDGQRKPKSNLLTLKRRPLTIKKQEFQNQMQIMVNNFLQKFSQIHQFVKEKNVKKQIFIGEKALSKQKYNKITKFNDQVNEYIIQKIRRKVQSRNKVQFSEQGPIVRNFEGIILRWSKQKNIPRLVYEKGLAKMQQKIRQFLIELRFQKIHKIFSLYRQFESSQQTCNLPLHKRHEIYVQKLQKKLNRKQEISLQLNFDWSSVINTRLECQRETFRKVQFGINPRIGFDNWVPIQEGARYSHEAMRYQKKQPIPEWMCHPRIEKNEKETQCVTSMRISKGEIDQNEYQKDVNNLLRSDDMGEMEFIFDLIRIDKKEDSKVLKTENTHYTIFGSILELKNNSDQNNNRIVNKKSSSHSLSIRKMPSLINQDQQRSEHMSHLLFVSQQLLKYFFNMNKKLYQPFVSQRDLERAKIGQKTLQDQEIQEYILMQLGMQRYHLDYMHIINYSRDQQPQTQCKLQLQKLRKKFNPKHQHYYHPVNLVQTLLLPKHNSLIRRVSKEDKHQFDRLSEKSLRILSTIDLSQKRKSIHNYKMKNDVELEISGKYRPRTYDTNKVQKEMENLRIFKDQSLGKAYLLQICAYQTAKNKKNSLFTS